MPLFNVTIELQATTKILVLAESEEAAMEYAKENKDWADEVIAHMPIPDALVPVSADPLTHPSQTDYPAGTGVWSGEGLPDGEYLSVAQAFYGHAFEYDEARMDSDESYAEEIVSSYRAMKRELERRFESERKSPDTA